MMTSQSMTLERQADAVTGIRDLLAAPTVPTPDERKNPAPPAMIADCLYQAGYEDAKKERDYNPRACVEWQVAVDAMSGAGEREIAALVIEFCEDPNNRVRQTKLQMRALLDALRGRISGLALPAYAFDLPHGAGKIRLEPEVSLGRNAAGQVVYRNYEGLAVPYF